MEEEAEPIINAVIAELDAEYFDWYQHS